MMVCPSGFWRAKSVIAIVPPPPDLFSTTVDWPHATWRCCASSRPIRSVVPPGAAGTITRTASLGRQSARAVVENVAAAARPAAPDRMSRREIVSAIGAFLSRVGFLLSRNHRGAHGHAQAGAGTGSGGLFGAEDLEHVGQIGQLL